MKVKPTIPGVFTIGPFARLAGVSPKMLRTYDAIGLFRPVWLDRSSGYRFYSPAQLPALRRILALRDMGIGLAEVRDLVAHGADLRDALERRRRDLEAERAELDRRLAALDIRMRADAGADSEGGRGQPRRGPGAAALDVVVRPLASELVAVREVADDEDDADAFSELEAHVRDTGRRARRPPGAILPKPEAPASDGWQIFVPVTGAFPSTERITPLRLPACRAATAIVAGPYDRLGPARRALLAWVTDAGLEVGGPLRVLYLQFGAEPGLRLPAGYVVERAEDFVTELQLPIGGGVAGGVGSGNVAPGD